jgi:hypothetical protein
LALRSALVMLSQWDLNLPAFKGVKAQSKAKHILQVYRIQRYIS